MRTCERHGAGTEKGKDYTVLDIAYWFHNLPHIRFRLKLIENSMFDIYNGQYITSIIVFAVLCLFLCLTILAICVVFSILVFYLSKTKNSDDDKEKSNKKGDKNESSAKNDKNKNTGIGMGWKVTLFIIAIICGLSFFCGFYGVWNVYVGLGTVHNSSRDGVIWFKGIRDDFAAADFFGGLNIKKRIEDLRDDINSVGIFPKELTDQFIKHLDRIVDYTHKIKEDVVKANLPLLINLSRIDIEWIPQDIERYGNLGCGGLLAGVLSLAIVGLLFTCAVFSSNLLAIFILIAIFGILLNTVLMSVSLSASVLISDLCVDAKPFVRDQLNEWILYQYIVECPLNGNTINKILDSAESVVLKLEDTFGGIITAFKKIFEIYCKTSNRVTNLGLNLLSKIIPQKLINIPKDMNITCPPKFHNKVNSTIYEIRHQIRTYTQVLSTFKNIADCRRVNKDLYDGLNAVCGDINPGFLYIYLFTIFTFICLIIIIFCATFALIRSNSFVTTFVTKNEPKNEPKIQPKVKSKIGPKNETKIQSKVQPKVGPKNETKIQPKTDAKVEPKIKANKQIEKPDKKVNINANKTINK